MDNQCYMPSGISKETIAVNADVFKVHQDILGELDLFLSSTNDPTRVLNTILLHWLPQIAHELHDNTSQEYKDMVVVLDLLTLFSTMRNNIKQLDYLNTEIEKEEVSHG